jgi:flagellar protein FliS
MQYATALRGDPGQTYRSVDVASRVGGATPHGLIALLFEDLMAALRQAAFACEAGNFPARGVRITKALAILFSLEAGLDFTAGGDLAETLSRLYRGARERVANASVTGDAGELRAVADGIADIADAWRQIGR